MYFLVMSPCSCRLERMSNDSESTMSTLTKENENYKSVVAQKDLELKKYQERYVRTYICTCFTV